MALSGGPLRQYRDEIWYASMNMTRTFVPCHIYRISPILYHRPPANQVNNKAITHQSGGSLYLGLETTFAGHKGSCLASDKVERSSFQRIPLFDAAKIDIFLLSSKLFRIFSL